MLRYSAVCLSLVFVLASCVEDIRPDSERTIILDGLELTESKPGEFPAWRCNDYIDKGKTLIEVGIIPLEHFTTPEYIDNDEFMDNFSRIAGFMGDYIGYVLYDGTNKGTWAMYRRTGLKHRWDWGEDSQYSFMIKPDGVGLYYDFSAVETKKADDVYNCYKYESL